MTFGITPAGFSLMRFQDILAAHQAAYQAIVPNPNLAPDSVIGQRCNLEDNALALAWEGVQLAYNSAFPSLCDEGSIDNVMFLAGLTRKAATATVLKCSCVFSADGTIPVGALIRDSAGNVFAAVTQLSSGGSGTFSLNFACVQTGPSALPLTLNSITYPLSIQTPEANWTSVSIVSATPGTNQETLAEARVRRANSLLVAGSATLESIRSAILNNVPSVTACIVQENQYDYLDIYGNSAHSIHVICQSADMGSAEQKAIAAQIWAKRAGGINMNGFSIVNITDSQGNIHGIQFDYSGTTAVNVVVNYSLFPTDPNPAPSDVTAALTAALTAVFAAQAIGENALYFRVLGACAAVSGIKINTLTLNGGAADVAITYNNKAILGTVTVSET